LLAGSGVASTCQREKAMKACYYCHKEFDDDELLRVDLIGPGKRDHHLVNVCETCFDRGEDERRRDMEQAEYDERNPSLEDPMSVER
jgi:uncharacterized CHY-type Zn-finger protein